MLCFALYDYIAAVIENWICTDIINHRSSFLDAPRFPSEMLFDQLNCVDAVEKYGKTCNVLLLISPPPYTERSVLNLYENDQMGYSDKLKDLGYGDYYACKDFIKQTLENNTDDVPKRIIFIGELGASDGSSGMYKFLMENNSLKLELRELLNGPNKDIFGGSIFKELFIFKIQS